uniref:Uncharacterized protein n=1 Tax=Romanomermis culicivorax TaxID=13658 RepID=A0A915JW62_ROMCU
MKSLYEDISSDEEDIQWKMLEDINFNEDELPAHAVREDLEDITSEEKEEKTLDNVILEEEQTILNYDDDENEQYKTHTPHSSNKEKIYESVQISGGAVFTPLRYLCFMQPVGDEQIEEDYLFVCLSVWLFVKGTTVYEFYSCYWHSCPKCMKDKHHQLTADKDTRANVWSMKQHGQDYYLQYT